MSPRPIRRRFLAQALLPGAALLALLTAGCPSAHLGTGGSGTVEPTPVPGMGAAPLTKEGRAELARVAARIEAVAGDVRSLKSRLEFTFWSEQGALTLTGLEVTRRNERAGRPVGTGNTRHAVEAALLSALNKQPTGEVVVTLWRRESGWEVNATASFSTFRPLGARTAPGRNGLFDLAQASLVGTRVQQLLDGVEVPAGGAVSVDLVVRVRNGRVESVDVEDVRPGGSGRGGKPRKAAARVAGLTTDVVLLYAPGVGVRTVHLGLRLSHREPDATANGQVETSRVETAVALSSAE